MSLLGTLIRTRRGAMEMSLEGLARELGDTPGQTFLSRVERGAVGIPPSLATRLARSLRLPEAPLLNAAGFTTNDQIAAALKELERHVSEPAPRQVLMQVLDTSGEVVGERRRLMTNPEDAFLIDLSGIPNEPFVGEALVLRGRKPVDGIGVIAEIGGELSAWTYLDQGGKKWLTNGRGEIKATGYKILGVISRVASERTFIE